MQAELYLYSLLACIFLAVATLAGWAVSYVSSRAQVRQRLAASGPGVDHLTPSRSQAPSALAGAIKRRIEQNALNLAPEERGRRRSELIKAGYFSASAVSNFLVAQLFATVALPLVLYLYIAWFAGDWSATVKFASLAGAMALGYYGPEAYIKRRQRVLQGVYRAIFPDILDMMVVCVDAGLSLNAALERVGSEGAASSPELGMNFALMGAEMRAGRGTMEALQNFADRIGIDEAKSLALLIQQSLELGTDVSQALRTFSDEMRDKRASRAEEKAAALPAKLVIPMGAFIFPVILVVILTPILLKLARSFGAMS